MFSGIKRSIFGLIQVFNADCTCHEVFRNLETGHIKACGVVRLLGVK